MKKTFVLTILCSTLLFVHCKKEKDTTHLITKTRIGKLDRSSLARDLEVIFDQDSIVKDTTKLAIGFGAKKIKIFEKGGNHLLTLTPTSDSIPTIGNIRIFDPRYVTEKGIGPNSTFKDIKNAYTISKVVTAMNNVVVFIKNSDMYFTIAKKELPSSLRYSSSVNIEAVQIPDQAKIKYMMIGWD